MFKEQKFNLPNKYSPDKPTDFSVGEKEKRKKTALERVKKAINVFMAFGFISLSPGIFETKFQPDKTPSPEAYVTLLGEKDFDRQEMLKEKVDYIIKEYSSEAITRLMFANDFGQLNLKRNPAEPNISGFEQLGLRNEDLKKIWNEDYYPKDSINKNLKSVAYLNEVRPMRSVNQKYSETGEAAAVADNLIEDKISIFRDKERYLKISSKNNIFEMVNTLDFHFSHDLGHINDWTGNNKLTPGERLDFLYEVSRAKVDPNSLCEDIPSSKYVKTINNKDPQIEKYFKAAEYWAVLCGFFLNFPEEFEDIATAEEKQLINKWLLRGNSYDAVEANKKRITAKKRLFGNPRVKPHENKNILSAKRK